MQHKIHIIKSIKNSVRGSPIITDDSLPITTRRNLGDRLLPSPNTALARITQAKKELLERQKKAKEKSRDAGRTKSSPGIQFAKQSGSGKRQKWATFN